MSWRADSTMGAHIWDTQPLTDDEIKIRDEELAWLKRHERRGWKLVNGRLMESGEPLALEGAYGGLLAYPPAQDLTAVTGGAVNVAWWSGALYTPFPQNGILAPDAYRIAASGRITSSAAGQTITPTAHIGTAIGTGLANGAAAALGSTITNALWYLFGDVTIRAAGNAGVAIGAFKLVVGQVAGAATGANVLTSLYGDTATQTAIDFTAASMGLQIGATPSAAGVSVTPTQVHWMSWN